MCGRSSLTRTERELEERFGSTFYSEDLERYNPLPSYNVAPTHMHPVITNKDPGHFHYFRWGLIPFWAKDKKIGYKMINARMETLTEKSTFKVPLQKSRCIVPFDGYYEWVRQGKEKLPYRITRKDGGVFSIAGLWSKWNPPEEGDPWYTFTLITRPPSESIAHIHNRMPAMLTEENERHWLDMDLPVEDVLELLNPFPDEDLHYYRVSQRVNKVGENDEELVKPIEN